ncbi:MAG TPA: branched-chain amino acid ABC transporter permease, partial [Bacillota bacterium]|nr:branched-chain amino acid ABC transporter permease [Bacillota bacterium]
MSKTVIKNTSFKNIFTYLIVIAGYMVMQIAIGTGNISSSLKGQLVPICAYIVMAVSLNLTVGVLGELSLGHAGYMSVGAFAGVVASTSLENMIAFAPLRLGVSMAFGAACAGVAGILVGVPVLRLAGDYLAIVTLAFGEIIKNIINSLYIGLDDMGLHFHFLGSAADLNLNEGGKVIINGPMGVAGIKKISTFTAGFILVVLSIAIVLNLINSRSGRAIMALRDNRIAAESVGISVVKYKLIAFVISASLAGAAGALYAMNYSTIVASKFNFNTSILILVFVVLGGLGNITGSIIAAVVLTVLPEMLRKFNDYRMLIYSIVLILVMIGTN